MASPYWHSPGILQGRIEPDESDPADGTYIFCLGEDKEIRIRDLPHYLLEPNDEITVEQAIDLTDVILIRFALHMRVSRYMPAARNITYTGNVDFRAGNLLGLGSNLQGLLLPDSTSQDNLFVQSDSNQILRVSGTANNNADFRVSGVPWNQSIVVGNPGVGEIRQGRVGILEGAVVNEISGTAVLKILGARWRVYATADSIIRLEHTEPAGDGWHRLDLAMHVSKLLGNQTVAFTVRLESVEP